VVGCYVGQPWILATPLLPLFGHLPSFLESPDEASLGYLAVRLCTRPPSNVLHRALSKSPPADMSRSVFFFSFPLRPSSSPYPEYLDCPLTFPSGFAVYQTSLRLCGGGPFRRGLAEADNRVVVDHFFFLVTFVRRALFKLAAITG